MSGLAGEAGMLPTDLSFGVTLLSEGCLDTEMGATVTDVKEIVLQTPVSASNTSGEITGSVAVKDDGILVARWSNAHSWVSPKMIARYKIVLGQGESGGYGNDDWG